MRKGNPKRVVAAVLLGAGIVLSVTTRAAELNEVSADPDAYHPTSLLDYSKIDPRLSFAQGRGKRVSGALQQLRKEASDYGYADLAACYDAISHNRDGFTTEKSPLSKLWMKMGRLADDPFATDAIKARYSVQDVAYSYAKRNCIGIDPRAFDENSRITNGKMRRAWDGEVKISE